MMADNIEHVTSYWVIFQVFESPILAGFAIVSHWAPFLFLGVYTGTLADRFDCRKIALVAQSTYMSVSLAWALLFLTDTIQMWHAMVLLIFHGLAGALWAPASQLVLHDIVGRDHLQSAVRLNAIARQLSILMGPAVGGGLMLLIGPAYGLMVNVAISLPLLVWAVRTPYTGHLRDPVGTRATPRLGLGDAARVLRGVASNRNLLAMVMLGGMASLLVGNAFQALMPQFATDFLGNDSGALYTVLLTANAVGAITGGIALESTGLFRAQARTAILLAGLWCFAIAAFAAAPLFPMALVALFFAGIFNLGYTAMAQTIVQLEAPPDQRGRIIGVFNMSQQGLRVGSGLTVGVLGAFIGIHWSLGLSAAALLVAVAALFVFARSAWRQPAVGVVSADD